MALPSVSVIIPAFNHARYVKQAVLSALRQTHSDLEVIVVDDGSTDGTAEVVAALAREDSRVRPLSQTNQGAHAALNNGMSASTGQYLALLNSDDYYYPQRIATLLAAVAGGRSELAFSLIDHVDDAGKQLPPSHPQRRAYLDAHRRRAELPSLGFGLLEFNLAATSGNFVFSRALLERLSGFAALRLCHDWDFLLRALQLTEPLLVEQPLMAYRIHGNNSFKQLDDVAHAETYACLGSYFRGIWAGEPENQQAPCSRHWPYYFDWYAERSTVLSSIMAHAAGELAHGSAHA